METTPTRDAQFSAEVVRCHRQAHHASGERAPLVCRGGRGPRHSRQRVRARLALAKPPKGETLGWQALIVA